MKKTMILLAAMVGVTTSAYATEGTQESITLSGITNMYGVVASSHITMDNLATIIDTPNTNQALLGITVHYGTTDNSWAISVGSWSSEQQLHIYNNKVGGQSISGSAGASFSDATDWPAGHKIQTMLTSAGAVDAVLTLGYQSNKVSGEGPTGTSVVLSVLYEDGTIKSIYGNNSAQMYANYAPSVITFSGSLLETPEVTTSTTRWTKDSLVASTEAMLAPEPATATLSLLALAGLCARRRR